MPTLTKLTKKQKKAYLANSSNCPYCHSPDIGGGFVEIDGDTAWQRITCNNPSCSESWDDIYSLSDIQEVE